MSNKSLLSWQIGAAFIGTIVGAGFASGQEIMFFFTSYGTYGLITLLLSGLMFIFTGYAIFYTSKQLNAYNYSDFINKVFGNRLSLVYDAIISVFLFLGASIMFSGSGAIFRENLGLPSILGIVFISMATLVVVLFSVKGLLSINSILVPVLSGIILIVFVAVLSNANLDVIIDNAASIRFNGAFRPIFSFLFYCSYNLVLSVGVLIAFSENVTDISILRKGAYIGGIGLMLLSFLLNICLILNAPAIFGYSIPILHIIRGFSPAVRYAVGLCIWCAVFSTAIANVFSLVNRLCKNRPGLYGAAAAIVTAACIPLSLFDFKKLISFFYPLFGALSIFLIFQILFLFIKLKFSPSSRLR